MYQQPRSLLVGNIKIKQDLILSSAEDIVSLVTYLLSLNVYMSHNSFKFKVITNIEIILKLRTGLVLGVLFNSRTIEKISVIKNIAILLDHYYSDRTHYYY